MAASIRAISPSRVAVRRRPTLGRLQALTRRAVATIREWRARARERRQLAEILASRDHRVLRDLLIDRFTAEREIDKPFWRP